MSEIITHPSFLELDKLAVGAGGAGSEITRLHVASCAQCTSHLERLRAPAPIPEWVRTPPQPWWMKWMLKWTLTSPSLAWAGAAAAALVIAGGVYALRAPGSGNHDAYQEKGTDPALAIFVKRGQTIGPWDGSSAVQGGDQLRLQVAPEGYTHITVDSPQTPKAHLFDGDLTQVTAFLPVSWKVDDQPGPEVLDITLTRSGAPAWHSRIELPKVRQSGAP